MQSLPPEIGLFACAELFCLLVHANDIRIIAKRKEQRTKREQHKVERGLVRSVLLSMLLFCPASAAIVFFTMVPVLESGLGDRGVPAFSVYAVLGVASYGFPFATLRRLVTRIALQTLKEFADLQPKEVSDDAT